MNIDSPVATSRRRGSDISTVSLYQQCHVMMERLCLIEHFKESYLDKIIECIIYPKKLDHHERAGVNSQSYTNSGTQRPGTKTGSRKSIAEVLISSAHVYDPVNILWNTFRQGAALCHIANLIQADSVTANNVTMPSEIIKQLQSSEIQHPDEQGLSSLFLSNKCKSNVYYFLIACRTNFNLSVNELFTLSELYKDDTNGFIRVLKTVNILIDKLTAMNIIPKNLKSTRDSVRQSIDSSFGRESYNRRISSDPRLSKLMETRIKVILELLETERKYVSDLELLQDYMRQLKSMEAVSTSVILEIFANLDELLDFQRKFLIYLESYLTSSEEQTFANVFVRLKDGFDMYQLYCSNHKRATVCVQENMANLQKLSQLMDPAVDLPSYLIKPVQRICKYPLLIQELIKNTPPDHSDYSELLKAATVTKLLAEKVNEGHRRQENQAVLGDLEKRVEDWQVILLVQIYPGS
jgi:cell division control protein 24